MIRTVLSISIPLDNVTEPIKHVLADCGLGAPDNAAETAYSLAEFEQAFSKLTPGQQQQVLAKLKKIMEEIK
jgi:hypothetical protein